MELKANHFPRYKNDGTIHSHMNSVMLKFKKQLLKKIKNNTYCIEEVENCLCGSREWKCISETDRHGLPFGTVICHNCGLIRTTPRLSESSLSRFYDEDYLGLTLGIKKMKPGRSLIKKGQGKIVYKYIRPYFKPEKNYITVCEIGAASGTNLIDFSTAAKEDGFKTRLIGCDYSRDCVEAGRKKNIELYLGNEKSLIQKGFKCDIIILSHVLEHIISVDSCLMNLKKLLCNDGFLYIEVPGVMDLKNKFIYDCDYIKYATGAHIYNFNRATLIYYVEKQGFRHIQADEYIRSVFEVTDDTGTSIDLGNNYANTLQYLLDLHNNSSYYDSLIPRKYKLYRDIIGLLPHGFKRIMPHKAKSAIRQFFRNDL